MVPNITKIETTRHYVSPDGKYAITTKAASPKTETNKPLPQQTNKYIKKPETNQISKYNFQIIGNSESRSLLNIQLENSGCGEIFLTIIQFL